MVKTKSIKGIIGRKTSNLVTKKQLRLMEVKEIQDLRMQGELSHFTVKYVNGLVLAKLGNHKSGLGPFLVELRHYCCDKKNEKNIQKIFTIFGNVAAIMNENVIRTSNRNLETYVMSIQEVWIKKRLNSILINTPPLKQEDVMIAYSSVS